MDERDAVVRSYPDQVRQALAQQPTSKRPFRPRRRRAMYPAVRAQRMQGAARRLEAQKLGYLLEQRR